MKYTKGKTYSLSKSSNLFKILNFTYLNGEPFWISQLYSGDVSDEDIFEQELAKYPELLTFLNTSAPTDWNVRPETQNIDRDSSVLRPHVRDLRSSQKAEK